MTNDHLFGDRLVKLFPMIREPSSGLVKSLQKGTFAAVRLAYSGPVGDPTLPSPPDEAFALCLRLQTQRADTWLDGRHVPKGALKDETSIYDLRCETIVHFYDPFDFLYLHLPHNALSELANELDVGRVEYDVVGGTNSLDPILAHLGGCLLPMLERPHEANELFVGHVAMALNIHFLRKYAVSQPRNRSYRSGLAPWQLRTAKSLMRENLNGEIALARIASECGVSTAHFSRAFRVSTGTPPHRWLMNQRIEQSKALLINSTSSLTEIAIKCGFSDQSHFTRVFSAAVGTTPGRWRLIRKD
ncbi:MULTISPECIES: helix-turn-helix domain-containing protein [unclassified Bradyrhizobium]|uniref:helix-turn-helix domain-containing protein n=1 Tax=unclassified Bradyrhizobium TaxID=2631580 RepID=UPI001FF1F352|nr:MULTISPECIES: AraC family transcriptional regulator [unclassified Bradyrhizobium]MCJ9699824.1 AraC family transcriptional regulator [Bradyrhizobium sp. SHOUNA76]MCJ9728792.1 AraC family transcriptional regulator [Bradyrhizobium sp. PRIMUS42]